MRDTQRERGRDTGRGRSRLHAGSLTWDSILGLQDHTLGRRQALKPLSHPGCPSFTFLTQDSTSWGWCHLLKVGVGCRGRVVSHSAGPAIEGSPCVGASSAPRGQ